MIERASVALVPFDHVLIPNQVVQNYSSPLASCCDCKNMVLNLCYVEELRSIPLFVHMILIQKNFVKITIQRFT